MRITLTNKTIHGVFRGLLTPDARWVFMEDVSTGERLVDTFSYERGNDLILSDEFFSANEGREIDIQVKPFYFGMHSGPAGAMKKAYEVIKYDLSHQSTNTSVRENIKPKPTASGGPVGVTLIDCNFRVTNRVVGDAGLSTAGYENFIKKSSRFLPAGKPFISLGTMFYVIVPDRETIPKVCSIGGAKTSLVKVVTDIPETGYMFRPLAPETINTGFICVD